MLIGSHIGRYLVLELLGEGAMGAVYLVEHIDLNTRHAIKVLRPELASQPHIVQRFRNEARASAAARSPNIVAVRDVGQLDNQTWYLVMDYWEGESLSVFLASHGPLTHRLMIRSAVDTLNGLAAAHGRNIIHRDLKPDNLYVARVGDDLRTMLLDFGVCRMGEDPGLATRTGAVLGTPRYMAPEQFRGESFDHRADLWAFGAILYEMATQGWLPYDDETAPRGQVVEDAVLKVRMSRPPVDPQRRCPGLSRALADAILMLIDPDPAKRPPSASQAALLLAETLPAEGSEPSGLEIVQERAPELLRSLRSPAGGAVSVVARNRPSRYAIRHKVGMGGMAEVFRADALGAEGFARPVALKRVLAGLSEAPAFATRFCDEARLASHLNHPNVVPVLDFDRDVAGRLYLVMEYVAGKDLGAILATGRLPAAMAIFIVSEILRGLDYAHALPNPSNEIRSVVHRDVSPHNVLVSWEGAVKVSDFGIAKALGASGAVVPEGMGGKPSYMSPEQVSGQPLDGRSDLFSVGVVLWEALTGVRLFKSESAKETFQQILFRDAVRPSSIRPDIPADLEAVTVKLLMRDREQRYATAEQAIEDLARCADNPRNGRSELVRLLASRFPAEVKARSQVQAGAEAAPPPPALVHPPSVSTLGGAASQWAFLPPRMQQRHRRWFVGAITAAVVSAGTFLFILVAHRSLSAADPASQGRPAAPLVLDAEARPPGEAVRDAALRAPDATSLDAAVTAPLDADVSVPLDAAVTAPLDAAIAVPADAAVSVPRPAVPLPVEVGVLSIYVTPFAQVWIDDASTSVGQTPLHLRLRAGRHRIRLANERLHKELMVTVFINTAKEVVIDETWQ